MLLSGTRSTILRATALTRPQQRSISALSTLHWTTEAICRRYDSGAEVDRHLPRDGGRLGEEGEGGGREKRRMDGREEEEEEEEGNLGEGGIYSFPVA